MICHACTRPAWSTGLCQRHYNMARRDQMPPCTVDGCDLPQAARRLCLTHYKRQRYTGDVNAARPIGWRPPRKLKPVMHGPPRPTDCMLPTCNRPHYSHGYCKAHGRRVAKYGNPVAIIAIGERHNWDLERQPHQTPPNGL